MRLKSIVAAVASLVLGCKDDTPDPGEVVVEAVIGPEGGELAGAGVTLTVPPGAITTEYTFRLRAAGDNLSASTYRQSGGAFQIEPLGQELLLPARLTFSEGPSNPAILFKQDGMTVAGDGLTTYINELGLIAAATAGARLTNVSEPIFAATPEAATTVLHDTAHFAMQVTETPRVNVVLTLYDFEDLHAQDLNGASGEGDCGLEILPPTGASLSRGCGNGPLTAQLAATSTDIQFDAVPLQAGNVNPGVPMGVVMGSEQLAYFFGFVMFDTSPCYAQECDNQGMCVLDGAGAGSCMCNAGFEVDPADPFSCNCVPLCDGRECGPDPMCGVECGVCGVDEFCDGEGQCQMADPTGTDSTATDSDDPSTGSSSSSSTTDTDTDTGTGSGTVSG